MPFRGRLDRVLAYKKAITQNFAAGQFSESEKGVAGGSARAICETGVLGGNIGAPRRAQSMQVVLPRSNSQVSNWLTGRIASHCSHCHSMGAISPSGLRSIIYGPLFCWPHRLSICCSVQRRDSHRQIPQLLVAGAASILVVARVRPGRHNGQQVA